MRVLQVAERFPPAPGGVERHVRDVVASLRDGGHDVSVLTSDMYRDLPFERFRERPAEDDRTIRRFTAWTLPGESHFPAYPGMVPAALRQQADVVHLHAYGTFATWLGPAIRRLRRIRTILTPHFHPAEVEWGGARRAGLRRLYDRTIGRTTMRELDAVIVQTGHERRLLHEAGLLDPSTPVYTVPNGIDVARYRDGGDADGFRRRWAVPKGAPLILFVGRLAPKKGLETLFASAHRILRELPEARFVIVGEDMGLGQTVRSQASRPPLRGRMIVTGPLPDRDVIAALHACTLLVLPSEYEAFGLVLAEAMACRRPCVATRVGGVPEVVEDGRSGFLVPPRDSEALADSIVALVADPDRARAMGATGQAIVEERFSLRRQVERLVEIYND